MEFRPFRVPLVTPFRGVSERTGVLIRRRASDGTDAWGEYSPFPDYDARRASLWWRAAMEAASGDVPRPVRESVPVNAIVPEVPAAEVAAYATAGGCRTAKVKVAGTGATLDGDCARVAAAAAAVARIGGNAARVRIDANGAWGVEEAVEAVRELDAAARGAGVAGLEYVEQPCRTVAELAAVRARIDVPVAADESVRLALDALAVARAGAADILVVKVSPLGGVRACLEIAERAALPVVVSSALETSVGLATGLALALALPDLPFACGLGTGSLLAGDVVAHPLVPSGGELRASSLEVVV